MLLPVFHPKTSALLLLAAALGCAGTLRDGPWMRPLVSSPAGGECTSRTGVVAWTLPASESDAAVLGRWCSGVGPVAMDAFEGASPEAVDALVLVTWNVHVGGGDLVGFVQDLRSGALTGAPVESFVLLLQEAYREGSEVPRDPGPYAMSRIDAQPRSGARIDVVEAARRLGLHLFYAPSMRNGGAAAAGANAEDRGNAILSTHPLEDLAAIELPFEVQRRVAVAGTLSATTREGHLWSLRVVSGHLDTRTRWSRALDSFGAARARQAEALLQALEGPAVVLGADLNTWSAGFLEEAVPLLRAGFPQTPEVTGPTFLAAGVLPRRLDHLLFRLPPGYQARAWRVDDRYGSDHFPLLAVVRFGAEPLGRPHPAVARNTVSVATQSASRR